MATISKRTNKDGSHSYRVGYRNEAGKLCWTPTLTSPEGAAKVKDMIERIGYQAALAVLSSRQYGVEETILVKDLFELYLLEVAASATSGTVHDYRLMANRTWLPMLGEYPLQALTRAHVVQWVAWQREQPTQRSQLARKRVLEWNRAHPKAKKPMPEPVFVAPKTIRNAHGLLSQMLNFAVDSGEYAVERNVAYRVKLPSDMVSAPEMDIFTPEEFQRFYAAMDPDFQLFTKLLLVTGMRISEGTALQVRDFDLQSATPSVHVRRAWKKGKSGRYLGAPKSRRAFRTIYLGASITQELLPLVHDRDGDEFMFIHAGGHLKADTYYRGYWWPAIAASGIRKRLTPHSLRHTAASWMLMAGVAPQVVQHRLGHESLETTSKRYAHLLIDAQLPAANIMDVRTAGLHQLPSLPPELGMIA